MTSLPGVARARRIGTIAALDVEVRDTGYLSAVGPRMLARFRDAGLLLRPLGNTVYVMPPYCIEEPDLAALYAGIAGALHELAG